MFRIRTQNKVQSGVLVGLLLIIVSLSWSHPAPEAEQPDNLESYFTKGLILYRNKQFDQAKINFLTAIADPARNPQITASYLMIAKTFEKLNNPDQAINYAQILIKNYPQSRYVGDAYFIIATAYLRKGKDIEAIDNFLFAIENSRSKKLTTLCERLASKIVDRGISEQDLEGLFARHKSKTAYAWLTLWVARTKYALGQKDEADALISTFLSTKPEERFARAARELMQLSPEELAFPVRIGVVLPLSGYFSDEAQNMLKGIALAIKERKTKTPRIELLVRDSQVSAGQAVTAMLALLKNDLSIVVGELEGTKSAALAGLCTQSDVPLIVPIATDNGIAAIGSMVFQANNDIETRGSVLAKYAIDSLKMRTFATLSPADDYGHDMTDAFSNTVDRLGGTIISQQWYYPGTEDFKRQFMAVREAGFRYALRDSLIASNIPVRPSRIDSLFRIWNARAKELSDDDKGLLESTDIPVTTIDGFFLPIYEEDISLVAPQLALANIQSRLLGGDNWLNVDALRNQRNYVNGVVFVSGYYISETDLQYRDFQNRFRRATATSPSIMAVYGYNIMQLIISAVDAGYTQADEIVSYLETVEDFPGIGGEMTFHKNNHVNSSVNILQFQDGNIIRLE